MEGTNSHDGAGDRQAGPCAGPDGNTDHRPAGDTCASALVAAAGPTTTPADPDSQNGQDVGGRTYAALDLGTNNCRLLVARPSRRGFKVVDAFSRIIRLGEGVSTTGRLSQAAIERTIDALRVCAAKMDRNKVERAGLIATEACRLACNAEEFLGRVRKDTGLDIKIVDRETEAKLAVSGCASLIDHSCDFALVFDIGGGSSELIWLDLTRRKYGWRRSLHDRLEVQSCIAAWTSLPVGVVTLAEQFGGKLVNAEIFAAMVRHVACMLEPFEAQHGLSRRVGNGKTHLLGTSGTVTTVAGVHLRLPRYERNKVDGCWLDIAQARTVTAELLASSYEERAAQPCVGKERADLVLAGCAILEALLQTWPCQRLRVADRGLREGILATLMTEDGVYRTGNRATGYRR
ncbi:MAG TPA: Ppx/GppA phosphatase family protein [Hyphomicrobiaceae bacterium]|nr:Ppx/GppA phosphatase family protein [Hyphomicrobiaceae bacterium]